MVHLERGQIIDERYRVTGVLGQGGMGFVYLARDQAAKRDVALKLLALSPEHPDLAGRFLRGARLSRRIKHPHVTQTYAIGTWGTPVEGHYMVMEYVDGVALGEILDAQLEHGVVCSLASQVLSALAHVHAHGVLHRDIKPDNIMITRLPDGELQAKLTDFGIAASLSQDMNVTEDGSGVVVGTPAFMAPEQVQQCGVYGPALDLYALGTTLYRVLSGKLPFNKSGMALLVARVTDDPKPIEGRHGATLPSGLSDVIMKLLQRQPEDRYAVAADVIRDLAEFCEAPSMTAETWEAMRGTIEDRPESLDDLDAAPTLAEEVVNTVALAGLKAPAQRPLDNPLALWGRESFVASLAPIIESAEQGAIEVSVLSGPLGIGKSSLVKHVAFTLAEQGRFVVLRSAYHRQGGANSGLKYAFDSFLGTVGRGSERVRDAVLEFLRRHDDVDSQEADDLVNYLRPRRLETGEKQVDGFGFQNALATRMLRRISRVKPVMLVLDGLDQGGKEALSLISHLVFEARFSPFPILYMGAYSNGLSDDAFEAGLQAQSWSLSRCFHHIAVPPLPQSVMIEGLIEVQGLDKAFAEQVAERSEGNPLFALHLALAGEEGLKSSMRTRVAAHGSSSSLPVHLARVLKLSLEESLATTQAAEELYTFCTCLAVLGGKVEVALLERYVEAFGLMLAPEAALDPLLELGLVVEGPMHAQDSVALQPALLRDLLLNEMKPRKRKRLERLAAETRLAHAGDRLDSAAGAIGDHYDAAGMHAEAVDYWRRAMPFSARAGNPAAALGYGQKALVYVDPSTQDFADIALMAGQLSLDMGELKEASTILSEVVQHASADNALIAGDLLADVHENAGDGEAWSALIEAMSAREDEASAAGLRALYCARSMWLISRGLRDQGFAEAQRAVAIAKPGRGAQRAAQRLVYTCLSRGELDLGEEAAREALRHAGEQPEAQSSEPARPRGRPRVEAPR